MSDSGSESSSISSNDFLEGSSSGESAAEEQQVAGCESASEHGGSDKAESEATGEASDGNGDDGDRDDDDRNDDEEDDRIGKRCTLCHTWLDVSMLETADECLDCDGGCGRELPPSEMRIRCGFACDFDMCTACFGLERRAARLVAPPPLPQLAASSCSSGLPAVEVPMAAGEVDASAETVARGVHVRATEPAAPAAPARDMINAMLARMAAQRSKQQTRSERAMGVFVAWQAERAAANRATRGAAQDAAPDREPAAEDMSTQPTQAEPGPGGPATPSTDYQLPPPPTIPFVPAPAGQRLQAQVAGILRGDAEQRGIWLDMAQELLHQAGHGQAQEASPARASEETGMPIVLQSSARAHRPPIRIGVDVDTRRAPLLSLTRRMRCVCCDDEVGTGDVGRCSALELLAALETDLAEEDRLMQEDIDAGASVEPRHRAARKRAYRLFVAAHFGYLGSGVRKRIPDCAVAAIRMRYPAPGCDCPIERIATCVGHGYAGFREA